MVLVVQEMPGFSPQLRAMQAGKGVSTFSQMSRGFGKHCGYILREVF
jgi:hypothetical protein